MDDFTYKLPIADKINIIRNMGFVVMPRAEFEARFPGWLKQPGAYVIHSDEWNHNGLPDEGMVDVADDPVILEASFAEAYSDDEWTERVTMESVEEFHKAMDAAWRRRHLKVVK
jgi:hypothetical protein